MQTLIIDRKGSRLSLRDGRLRIELPDGERTQHIPLTMIERVVVTAGVDLHTALLGALAEAGVSLLILSPRDHRRIAIVTPPHGRDHAVRLAQYRAAVDPERCVRIAAVVVRMKLLAQCRNLRRLARRPAPVREALRTLPELARRLRDPSDMTLGQVRGLEGGGAACYFAALAAALPESLGFTGRNRRPPTDPLNALLSLGYTLLHFDAVRALLAAGFDPCIGFLHSAEYSRESLACDLIEPLRPAVDRFALDCFHRRLLRPEHFVVQQGACRMGKAARRAFYIAWEEFAPVPRRALRRAIPILRREGIGC
ncbi:MAG: CRISPR-associated endonuclease Cas1 [Zetaproteobacteria bacterium]|nr:MAG: CRISPR-associated endonuclease Cas1 [Zetaproteobacteria bacterium]